MLMRSGLAVVMALALTLVARAHADDALPEPELLPNIAVPEGWELDSKLKVYIEDNLFGYINGESVTFFPYGFEQLTVAHVHPEGMPDEPVVIQLYRMGSPLDAFGIYSTYRGVDDDFVAIGVEGFIGTTQLVYFQDRYFVKIHFLQPRGEKSALRDMARRVSELLPAAGGFPEELEAVKVPGLIPESVVYHAREVMGYDFLPKGFSGTVERDNDGDSATDPEQLRVAVILLDSPESAKSAQKKVLDDLTEFGAEIEAGGDQDLVYVREPAFERGAWTRIGARLINVSSAPNPPNTISSLLELLVRANRGTPEDTDA